MLPLQEQCQDPSPFTSSHTSRPLSTHLTRFLHSRAFVAAHRPKRLPTETCHANVTRRHAPASPTSPTAFQHCHPRRWDLGASLGTSPEALPNNEDD